MTMIDVQLRMIYYKTLRVKIYNSRGFDSQCMAVV